MNLQPRGQTWQSTNHPTPACRDVADEADCNATPRSARVDGLNKGASDLPLPISGIGCDTAGTEVLEHDASSTPATTTIFRRFGSVDHRKLGSLLGMASLLPNIPPSKYQLLPHTSKPSSLTSKTRPVRAPQPEPKTLAITAHSNCTAQCHQPA